MNIIQALLRKHRKPLMNAKGKHQAGTTCETITNDIKGGG
jgi:hypothetical protein